MDKFCLVDADTVCMHESSVLVHATIPEVVDIVFPNEDVLYQSVTHFD